MFLERNNERTRVFYVKWNETSYRQIQKYVAKMKEQRSHTKLLCAF